MKNLYILAAMILSLFVSQNLFAQEESVHLRDAPLPQLSQGEIHYYGPANDSDEFWTINGNRFERNGERWRAENGHTFWYSDGGLYYNEYFFTPCGFDADGKYYFENSAYPAAGWCTRDGLIIRPDGTRAWRTNF